MSQQCNSPTLPTFGIRDLAGPSNPPALVSISRSQYDSTIKSQPDAKLLYLDDDDGELITVGSSLELGQRLEEPVPKYTKGNFSETRHPGEGQLVHVFDIKHSAGSLAEWRDHEAYSSKTLRLPSASPSLGHASSTPIHYMSYPPFYAPSLRPGAEKQAPTAPAEPGHISSATDTAENLPSPKEEVTTTDHTEPSTETFNLLDGIQEHLSGLANVLQFAATTLQKAADKTRETDTTVVEDILKGVKGILTEVGSFGLETFNELGREADAGSPQSASPPTKLSNKDHPEEEQFFTAPVAREMGNQTETVNDAEHFYGSSKMMLTENLHAPERVRKERQNMLQKERDESTPSAILDLPEKQFPKLDCFTKNMLNEQGEFKVQERSSAEAAVGEADYSDASSKRSPRVKFACVEDDTPKQVPVSAGSSASNPIIIDDSSSVEIKGKGQGPMHNQPPARPTNPSILDDSSDDADFLARYPPLRSIRRARSTIETGRHVSSDTDSPRFFSRGRRDYEPAFERANAAAIARAQAISTAEANKETQAIRAAGTERGHLDASLPPTDITAKPESSENTRKPLPGAWPDVKNESTPALPISGESSGAFFNRMIGRSNNQRSNTGLHRANTTASSNPASRLTGPFDPGFPYDPSSASSFRPLRSHPYRAYRRSASPSRIFNEQLDAARARRVEQMKNMPKPDTKPSMPGLPRARVGFGLEAPSSFNTTAQVPIGCSKYESHRGVRHHRSVPQFSQVASPPPPPPPPPAQPIPIRGSETRARFGDAIHSRPDFLSGPSPSNPPPIPFTARPAFVPHLPQPATFRPLRTGPNLLPNDDVAQNTPAVPAALSSPRYTTDAAHGSSPSTISLPSAREEPSSYWRLDSPPSQSQPQPAQNTFATVGPEKNKFDACVEQLKMCGFGCDDNNLRDRLYVYAVAADGEVMDAVEMIEEDRRLSRRFD